MPDTYTTLTALFTAVADALRAKTGGTAAIAAQSFPAAIADLPTGTDTSDATAGAGDILLGKTAYAGGVKLTGAVPSLAAATITPGAAAQTLPAGSYLAGDQTVAGDGDLTAENIRDGVSIFGVTGTLKTARLTPLHRDIGGGYVSYGDWQPSAETGLASDVYQVTGGHTHVVGLGGTVGNRLRAIFLTQDPLGAAAAINGVKIGDDSNSPTPYMLAGTYVTPSSGYIVVFKANNGTGAQAESLVLDVNRL